VSPEQILQNEINEPERWVDTAEGVYKRDLIKRIELINWVLENLESPNICEAIESKMNGIIDRINKTDSIFESDPLGSELRILDWIFNQVCKDQQNKLFQELSSQ
jgi:hypothetical protein